MNNFLLAHTLIELYANNNRFFITEEHAIGAKHRSALFESYGLFKGCEDAAKYIMGVLSNLNGQRKVIVQPDGIKFFIDEIVLLIDSHKGIRGAYLPDRTVVSDDGRFSSVTILINESMVDSNQLLPLLMHELTHVYQDYNYRLRGKDMIGSMNDNGYSNAMKMMQNRHSIYKAVAEFFYYFNKFESGADITAFHAKASSAADKKFSSITDAADFIKDCDVYSDYMALKGNADYINDICTRKANQGIVLDAANQVTNGKFNTCNQFIKWLNQTVNRTIKKVEEVIPKIACEKLNVSPILPYPKHGEITRLK